MFVFCTLFENLVRMVQGTKAKDVSKRTMMLKDARKIMTDADTNRTDFEEALKHARKIRAEFDKCANPTKCAWFHSVLKAFAKVLKSTEREDFCYSTQAAHQLESMLSPLFGSAWQRAQQG